MSHIFPLVLWIAALLPAHAVASAQDDAQRVPPFQIFDNLYYVGLDSVGAYVLKTSDGLILIDSLFVEFADHIPTAMEELGLNARDIKYVIVTHAHVDHTGGAKAMQALSGARVGMAEADWEMVESGGYLSSQGLQRVFEPLPRDLVIKDGDTLTLGDTTVKMYLTPGHTPGVTSLEFPITDAGRTYKAIMFGGIGLNTVNGVQAVQQYIDSVHRMMAISDAQVIISNHPGRAFLGLRDGLASRRTGDPHPLVDPDGVRASLESMLSNAERRLEAERAANRP